MPALVFTITGNGVTASQTLAAVPGAASIISTGPGQVYIEVSDTGTEGQFSTVAVAGDIVMSEALNSAIVLAPFAVGWRVRIRRTGAGAADATRAAIE